MDTIVRIFADTAFQVLYIGGLICVCAVVLLQIERSVSELLGRTFGWKSVLWTSWLGTPIHELSHAAMCIVFGHKINKIVLHDPNPRTGIMGYVQHSYNPKNPWAKLGCFFIGIAPLLGGALVLCLAMYFLVPSRPLSDLASFGNRAFAHASGPFDQAVAALKMSSAIFLDTLRVENFERVQFWLFLYVVLCIGMHISPSRADFAGSLSGLGAAILALLIVNVVVHTFDGVGSEVARTTARFVMPVVAMLTMAVMLNVIALACVLVIVVIYRLSRGESLNGFFRTFRPLRLRLGIVAGISIAVFLVIRSGGWR